MLGEASRLIAAGIALGLPLAYLAVAPWNPAVFAASAVLLGAVAGAATLVPAWRATPLGPRAILLSP